MKVDRGNIDLVEHWIRPLLPSVITIPLKEGGKDFVIYVSVPPIDLAASDKQLQEVAEDIAHKIERK